MSLSWGREDKGRKAERNEEKSASEFGAWSHLLSESREGAVGARENHQSSQEIKDTAVYLAFEEQTLSC